MASEPVLSVLFLWHQHQPYYKDPLSNRYEMPWVRLHAIKDYHQMAALVEEFPKIRANFNLVPSLLLQLDDYAQGKAQEKCVAMTLKNASDLSIEERLFILQNFFMAHWENMIDPFPRYRELLDKRGRAASGEALSRAQNYFKEQDWRDLQTWFSLAWFDPLWKERDPFIRDLYQKGRGFTEEEKRQLVTKQFEICGQIVPKHRQLKEGGQIEITASPFYHPILPLLCDTEAARMALPHAALPHEHFAYPEDAKTQIERAMEDHRQRFGQRPQGMWPSEGSVSEQAAGLLAEAGLRWVATDEAVLANSAQPGTYNRDDLYEPYQFQAGGKPLNFFFRDHELSDAIGFVYAGMKAGDAVNDFIQRLHAIRDRLKRRDGAQPKPHVVPVILDGENCWEYYKENGVPFLRELYGRLSQEPYLETVRAGEYLDRVGQPKQLTRLWSGSWINANFSIWIGHKEDNMAWDLVYRTRQFLTNHLRAHPELADSASARMAWEELYIAEGSDWCWWYGDDHSSANDEMFDYLFRKHLMNIYTLLGAKVPEDLHLPIKAKRAQAPVKAPVDFITPQIDGRVTSYFEWQAAGVYHTESAQSGSGTMHRAQNLVKSLYFGFDLQNLYFRIDPARPIDYEAMPDLAFKIGFIQPAGCEARVTFTKDRKVEVQLHSKSAAASEQTTRLAPGAAGKIIEFSIPLAALKADPKHPIEWVLIVENANTEAERWPVEAIISTPYPTQDSFSESWVV